MKWKNWTKMAVALGMAFFLGATSSSTQLPGCGMAECPQICGEKDCLNAKGECTCGGTTYDTYYADVSASSSDSSVAAATYSGGTLKIKAVGRGTVKITVTGSLRQHSDGKASLSVTVSSSSSTQSSKAQKSQETTKGTTVSKKTTTETKKKSTSAKASKKTKKTTEKGIVSSYKKFRNKGCVKGF